MEQSNLVSKSSDSYHMLSKEQRMFEAKRIYQVLRNTPQKHSHKEQDKSKDSIQHEDERVKEEGQLSNGKQHLCKQVCLAVLEGLQNGVRIRVQRKENPLLSPISQAKLKNIPYTTLKKVSKIFVELLPKNIINLSRQEFFDKYLFNWHMLAFFKRHDLSLIKTFRNLFQIKCWERENKEYLNRGFSRDYVPDDIMEKLRELSQTYKYMNSIYDSFDAQVYRLKRNKTPKTQAPRSFAYPGTNQQIKERISIQQLLADQIKKEEQEEE